MTRACHSQFDPKCESCNPIRTEYIYPPIPIRMFDWVATRDNYDLGSKAGRGPTEAKAIADLLEQEEMGDDT